MHPVGFEPTPPKRLRPERSALDRSATNADKLYTKLYTLQAGLEPATFHLGGECAIHCATGAVYVQIHSSTYCIQTVAFVAEWSKATDSSSVLSGGVGSNPTGSILICQCGRVVKAIDLKSIGLCPRRFEPCR